MKIITETYGLTDMVTITCPRCQRQWPAPADGEAGDGFSTCPRCKASVEVPYESGFRPGTPAPRITVLRGMPADESAALIIDRYGMRIDNGWMEDGEYRSLYGRAFLNGATVKHLAELLIGLWQCDECHEWSRGGNACGHCETACTAPISGG